MLILEALRAVVDPDAPSAAEVLATFALGDTVPAWAGRSLPRSMLPSSSGQATAPSR